MDGATVATDSLAERTARGTEGADKEGDRTGTDERLGGGKLGLEARQPPPPAPAPTGKLLGRTKGVVAEPEGEILLLTGPDTDRGALLIPAAAAAPAPAPTGVVEVCAAGGMPAAGAPPPPPPPPPPPAAVTVTVVTHDAGQVEAPYPVAGRVVVSVTVTVLVPTVEMMENSIEVAPAANPVETVEPLAVMEMPAAVGAGKVLAIVG